MHLQKRATENGYEWLLCFQYDGVLDQMVKEFCSGEHKSQPWHVVPAARLDKIWKGYAELGVVHNIKGLQAVTDQVLDNIVRLLLNTELAGHTQRTPAHVVEDYEHKLPNLEAFIDWAVDIPDGGWRISDYGLDHLLNLGALLYEAESPEEQLTYLDQILNVAHQRSDLASWFVEGGTQTLNMLAAPNALLC